MIRVENLSFNYPDGLQALKNINIDFSKGKRVAVIGGNGAGKSSLFLNCLGLLKAKTGKVFFKDQELKMDKKSLMDFRQKTSLLLQNPETQIFNSRVEDDIVFALKNLDYDDEVIKERLEELIKVLDLQDLRKKLVNNLSYGQKKRVALAGLLVMDLECIFLDEPLAGLDPSMKEEMIEIIHRLSDKGIQIILSSHDMDFVFENCDYIYLLDKGELLLEGTNTEIFSQTEILRKCRLKEPSLYRIHRETGCPLFYKLDDLIAYLKEKNQD